MKNKEMVIFLKIKFIFNLFYQFSHHEWERLNVGTVPMFKMQHVGTVPMFKMHEVGTVPTFKMHHVGTIKNQNPL